MTDEKSIEETAVSLQPSRELDALIAKRVMGWTWNDETAFSPYGGRWARKPDGEGGERWLPHYSTDITAAMEVWERLPKPRRLHETEVGVVVMCGGRSFGPDTDFIHNAIAMGETAAHAICLAALKAAEAKTQ